MVKILSLDEYEKAWWVRLGRFLRLNRVEILEVNAQPHICIAHIRDLEQTLPDGFDGHEIVVDLRKTPYRFLYLTYDTGKYGGKMAYIGGFCRGKDQITVVELEAIPAEDNLGTPLGYIYLLIVLGLCALPRVVTEFGTELSRPGLTFGETLEILSGPIGVCLVLMFVFRFYIRKTLVLPEKALNSFRDHLTLLNTTVIYQTDKTPRDKEAPRQDMTQG